MFYVLSKVLDVLLMPLSWAVVLMAYGAPLTRRALRKKKVRPFACFFGLAILVVFSTEPVANALFGALEAKAVKTMDPAKHYDAVILLGGLVDEKAMEKSRSLSINDNNERLFGTLGVMREGRADYAIISGAPVDPKTPYAEAQVLAAELVLLGVPKEKVIVEDKAMNTRENATYSAEIARARGFSQVLIVTSAFHMHRALACYEKAGMKVDTLPVDFRTYSSDTASGSWLPRASHLERSTAAIREWSGFYVYRARGYVD